VKVETTNGLRERESIRINLSNRFRVGVDIGSTLTDEEVQIWIK